MSGDVETKASLRIALKAALAAVPQDRWEAESLAACERAAALPAFIGAGVVLLYMPIPRELDVGPLARAAFAAGKGVAVTRADWAGRTLTPVRIAAWDEPMAVNRHGIREPGPEAASVHLATVDLIIVPGLGFDANGGRLGRGAGFYDRLLARPDCRAVKVGIGLDAQVVGRVPMEGWDVPLDAVVTPTRTLVAAGRGA